jgi:hypothetical protein
MSGAIIRVARRTDACPTAHTRIPLGQLKRRLEARSGLCYDARVLADARRLGMRGIAATALQGREETGLSQSRRRGTAGTSLRALCTSCEGSECGRCEAPSEASETTLATAHPRGVRYPGRVGFAVHLRRPQRLPSDMAEQRTASSCL